MPLFGSFMVAWDKKYILLNIFHDLGVLRHSIIDIKAILFWKMYKTQDNIVNVTSSWKKMNKIQKITNFGASYLTWYHLDFDSGLCHAKPVL